VFSVVFASGFEILEPILCYHRDRSGSDVVHARHCGKPDSLREVPILSLWFKITARSGIAEDTTLFNPLLNAKRTLACATLQQIADPLCATG
jgi:hypothetical protein